MNKGLRRRVPGAINASPLRALRCRIWLTSLMAGLAITFAAVTQGQGVQVLYSFDTDQPYRIADWLTADGSQDAQGLGSYSIDRSGAAAFGSAAIAFPVGAGTFGALEIPESSHLGTSFTLAVAANELGNNFSRLFSSYDGGPVGPNELVFDIDPSQEIGFGVRAIVNGTNIRRNLTFNDTSYHHLAMTFDNGQVQLYFNGSPLGPAESVSTAPVQLARNLRFGEDYPPTSLTNEAFEGFADDILVYDRALSPAEIESLHSTSAATLFGVSPPPAPDPPPPTNIGSRIEMFVDRHLIASSEGVTLQLHPPTPREISLQLNGPYETSTSTYFTALRDGQGQVRLYYRGYAGSEEVTLMAVSDDGINFTRPNLGLYERNGTSNNHIIWAGPQSHNLAPFIDPNPNASPDARWKALGGTGEMYAMKSADGIHWELMQEEPLEISGAFDSQNTAMWDETAGVYRSFSRVWIGGRRAIQMSTSEDFVNWTAPQPFVYDVPLEHFYTNSIQQFPGAEGVFVGFPMRLDPSRTNQPSPGQTGVSDAVVITSRDGVHWDREFTEPWIPEGFDTTRSNIPAWGIIETQPDEWSTYSTEQYRLDDNRLRRLTFRPYGIASVTADTEVGWFETPVFLFEGEQLVLNFRTEMAGHIGVEVRDAEGAPIPGFELANAVLLSGDQLAAEVEWQTGRSIAELSGTPVRLHFELLDADLYAMQFRIAPDTGLAGDYNNDGMVNVADYLAWRNAVGSAVPLRNDPIGGQVGADQYLQWKLNYGATAGGESAAGTKAVPEVAVWRFVSVGAVSLVVIRFPWRSVRRRIAHVHFGLRQATREHSN